MSPFTYSGSSLCSSAWRRMPEGGLIEFEMGVPVLPAKFKGAVKERQPFSVATFAEKEIRLHKKAVPLDGLAFHLFAYPVGRADMGPGVGGVAREESGLRHADMPQGLIIGIAHPPPRRHRLEASMARDGFPLRIASHAAFTW